MFRAAKAFAGQHFIFSHRHLGLAAIALFAVLIAVQPAEARRYGSIVIDAETGWVLHADNADRQAFPASLTKMMTLYLTFEALDLGKLKMNQKLTVSRRAAGMPASKLGLRRGRTITVKNAIMALITKSANDVAVVLAESLGGTESEFAVKMTRKARALGMSRTTFRNASGLPNKKQLSTARDMARLAQALQQDFPQYYKLFSTRTFSYKGRNYPNHNRLLRTYKGTDGVKTGYTRASGYNLAASVVRNGRRIIAVVFGGRTSRTRDRHMVKLLDRGFTRIRTAKRIDPLPGGPLRKPGVATPDIQVAGLPTPSAAATSTAAPGSAALEPVALEPAATAPAVTQAATRETLTFTAGALADPSATVRGAATAAELGLHEHKKKPAKLQLVAKDSRVPVPPAYAAIPERDNYDSAEGSADSPVRTPPPYTSIPARPVAVAASDTGNSGGLDFQLIGSAAAATGAWGVQVGAYHRHAPAERAARDAVSRLPDYLGGTQVVVSKIKGKKRMIYRARLMGMNEAYAREACGRLELIDVSCYVVAPSARG